MKYVIFFGLGWILAVTFLLVCFINANKRMKQELKEKESDLESARKQSEIYAKEKRENEELVQKMHSGNNLDSANASVELLHKLSEKGKERNSK